MPEVLEDCRSDAHNRWLAVQRSWDECSQYLEYGPTISEHIWQWRLQVLEELAAFTQADISELAGMIKSRQHGTCQILVQAAAARWGSGKDASASIPVAPTMVQRATASCLRRGLDQTLPLLAFPALAQLALAGLLVFLCLGQDSASANVSLSTRVVAEVADVPWLLVFIKYCDAHLLSLVLRLLLKRFNLLNHCFSLTLVLRQFTYRSRFFTRVITEICAGPFDYILCHDEHLVPDHRDVTTRILHLTLLRSQFRTRAALHRSAPQPAAPCQSNELMQERIEKYLLYFTDPVAGILRHHCSRLCACTSEREARKAMAAILTDLLQMSLPAVPAENKWASLSVILGFLSFMILAGGGVACKAWLAEFCVATLNEVLARWPAESCKPDGPC